MCNIISKLLSVILFPGRVKFNTALLSGDTRLCCIGLENYKTRKEESIIFARKLARKSCQNIGPKGEVVKATIGLEKFVDIY